MTVDRLFRAALLAVLLAFLYIAWGMKENGRYIYHPQTGNEGFRIVMDSRTGTVFLLDPANRAFIEIHPRTGEVIGHKASPRPTK